LLAFQERDGIEKSPLIRGYHNFDDSFIHGHRMLASLMKILNPGR
jgi:hypothetical protein